ncbi:MAG: Lytic transglycosylase catalytic [Alphaproteobacteria bacterium]|nr:Lytic transglycosylase catalytic [Alphaproteobacteria bacterium]
MPKPWELDWSGGSDPSGLDLLPIVPFFGGQRPPMLGSGDPAIVPPPMPTAGAYQMPAIDPSAMQAAGPPPAAAGDPSAVPDAGPSPPFAGDAFAAPATPPQQPLPMDALAQQASFPSRAPLPDPSTQPPQPWLTATPPIPGPPSAAAGTAGAGGQGLLQSAAFDSWSKPAAPTGHLARPDQTGPDPADLTLAQQRTTLPGGVRHMIPPAMLVHGTAPPTSARQPALLGAQPKRPAAGDVRNAPQLQKERLHFAPELFIPLPGAPRAMVNTPVWLDRLERVGERWRPGQVSRKGARGPMQVTLIGAKEAAQLLGINLDIKRWQTDPDYGRMLGQVDAAFLLQRYGGDVVLATAAYNLGYAHLNRVMKLYGDPRSGKISHEEFTQQFPFKETRRYIKRVIYNNMTEEQSQPKQSQPPRRSPPPLRSQQPKRRQRGG